MGLILSYHDRNGGSYRRISRVEKGLYSRAEGGLLLLFAVKQSEGHGYELAEIWNRKQLKYEGTLWWSHHQRRVEYRSIDTE